MTDVIKEPSASAVRETKEMLIPVSITEVDGRRQIVFKKSILKGKVTSADVLNSVLMAARMQAEMYIEKISRGSMLDTAEVKALKELADITKLEVKPEEKLGDNIPTTDSLTSIKSTLYQALTEKLSVK